MKECSLKLGCILILIHLEEINYNLEHFIFSKTIFHCKLLQYFCLIIFHLYLHQFYLMGVDIAQEQLLWFMRGNLTWFTILLVFFCFVLFFCFFSSFSTDLKLEFFKFPNFERTGLCDIKKNLLKNYNLYIWNLY